MDNTMLSDWDTCPTRFYWRHIRHLVLVGESTAALNYGTAFHKALEAYYRALAAGSTLADAQEAALRRLVTELQKHNYNAPYDPESGLANMLGYFERWPRDHEDIVVKQVEVNLQWELARDLVYCGRIDLLPIYLGQLYIWDHKTGGKIRSYCARPNHQFTGYLVGLKMLGFETNLVAVNLIGVLKTKTDYHRILTVREDWEMEQWRSHVLQVKTEIDESLQTGRFQRHTQTCGWCPYNALCQTDPAVVESVIPLRYETKRWEPWLEREEDEA